MSQLVFFIFAMATGALSTNVQFNNRCGNTVIVIKTTGNAPPAKECSLSSGQSCTKSYSSNDMSFRNGLGGKTLAEFSFNTGNKQDFYDLSVIGGYDTAMQISTDKGGPTVTCQGPGCSDAYLFLSDDKKTHSCPTGGTFQVTFCP